MLQYFYHGNYFLDPASCDRSTIMLDIQVYVLADKYLLEPLRTYAIEELGERMMRNWKEPSFADAVATIYGLTSGEQNEMRNLALQSACAYATELFGKDTKCTAFREMARSTPEFAVDVAGALAEVASKTMDAEAERFAGKGERCGICGEWDLFRFDPIVKGGFPYWCTACSNCSRAPHKESN